MSQGARASIDSSGASVALYHRVYHHEGFEKSAQILFKLVRMAQKDFPGKKRLLFLDIDGHRNSEGGFDRDMFELQTEFLVRFLGRFLSEIHCPLINAHNTKGQEDDIPDTLEINNPEDNRPEGTAEPGPVADQPRD